MSDSTQPSKSSLRAHCLTVAIAKHAFLHAKYGVVFVRDAVSIEYASTFGLTPIILYSVNVPGTAIRVLTFSAFENPLSFYEVLQKAWTGYNGLRGYPDILRVNRHVEKSCPTLADELGLIDILVETSPGSDKQFNTFVRSAQNATLELGWRASSDCVRSIDALNACSELRHASDLDRMSSDASHKTFSANVAYLAIPDRAFLHVLPCNKTWVRGGWLSSWEVNLPPGQTRCLRKTSGVTWLLDQHETDEDDGGSSYDYAADVARNMLQCWPNSPLVVAHAIGITAKSLSWYVKQQGRLDYADRRELLAVLGIEWSESHGEYSPERPCVLMAEKLGPIAEIYQAMCGGGDLDFSYEAIPKHGEGHADPSWRYLIFRGCGDDVSIIMFQRGSKVAERLVKKGGFINFDGLLEVEVDVYRDIVTTCAKACTDPLKNITVAEQFVDRNKKYFDDLAEKSWRRGW